MAPRKGLNMANAVQTAQPSSIDHGAFYTLFVEDREFRIDDASITGGQIMDMAGIPREVGLLLIDEDGTQRQVGPNEVIELKPGRRFRRAPRFKRG